MKKMGIEMNSSSQLNKFDIDKIYESDLFKQSPLIQRILSEEGQKQLFLDDENEIP